MSEKNTQYTLTNTSKARERSSREDIVVNPPICGVIKRSTSLSSEGCVCKSFIDLVEFFVRRRSRGFSPIWGFPCYILVSFV